MAKTSPLGQVGGGKLSPFLEQQRINKIIKHVPPLTRILDVGCGRARLLDYLLPPGSYDGIDLLGDVISENLIRFPQHHFYQADIERDAFPVSGSFDVITMLAIIEHLKDPAGTFRKIAPLLSENGILLLTTPHPISEWPHRIGASLGLFSLDAAREHNLFFDRRALRDLASSAKLVMVEYERFQCGLNQMAIFTHAP